MERSCLGFTIIIPIVFPDTSCSRVFKETFKYPLQPEIYENTKSSSLTGWGQLIFVQTVFLYKHLWLPSSFLKGHEELCTVSEWWVPFSHSTVLSDSLKGLWLRTDMFVSLKAHPSLKLNESSLSSALHELQTRSHGFSEKCCENLEVQAQRIFWVSV